MPKETAKKTESARNGAKLKTQPPGAKDNIAVKPDSVVSQETSGQAKKKAEKTSSKVTAQQPAEKSKGKPKKPKMVRDSFTMPENEYKVLGDVKRVCLKAGIEVKKSELLRVGVEILRQMDLEKLKTTLAGLAPVKAGRPKKP